MSKSQLLSIKHIFKSAMITLLVGISTSPGWVLDRV
jgi:hypothetical protein